MYHAMWSIMPVKTYYCSWVSQNTCKTTVFLRFIVTNGKRVKNIGFTLFGPPCNCNSRQIGTIKKPVAIILHCITVSIPGILLTSKGKAHAVHTVMQQAFFFHLIQRYHNLMPLNRSVFCINIPKTNSGWLQILLTQKQKNCLKTD